MQYASLYKLKDRKKCLKKPRTIASNFASKTVHHLLENLNRLPIGLSEFQANKSN